MLMDYKNARLAFLAMARQKNGRITTFHHPDAEGPDGEDLAVDIAVFENGTPNKLLLISSGVHGVEGMAGSASQTAAMGTLLPEKLPANTRLVMIHALNPHGFAHARRVNENGVDLNRNFIDWNAPKPNEHPPAKQFNVLLMKTDRGNRPFSRPRDLQAEINKSGEDAYVAAMVAGQYRQPDGLSFGGTGPCWSNTVWHGIMQRTSPGCLDIVHLDLHTGYGKKGELTILPAAQSTNDDLGRMQEWFGRVVEMPAAGNMPTLCGAIEESVFRAHPDRRVISVTAEIGTGHSLADNLQALEADQIIRAKPEYARFVPEAARQMIKHYAPTENSWRTTACNKLLGVVEQALRGMKQTMAP